MGCHGGLAHGYGPAGVGVRPSQRAPWFRQSVYLPGPVTIPVREPWLPSLQCAVNVQVRFSQRTHMVWLLHLHSLVNTPTQFGHGTCAVGWYTHIGRALCQDSTCGIARIQEILDMIKLEARKNTTGLLLLHLHSNMDEKIHQFLFMAV